jgi:uncharacterized protein (DUF58 family)
VSPGTTGRSTGRRTIHAAIAGVVAGAGGVVVARAVGGPAHLRIGVVVGVVVWALASLLSWVQSSPNRRSTRGRMPGGHRLRSHIHPVAWFGPVAGSVVAMLVWAGVAHSSGSGWVQAVGALLAAVLLTGLFLPAVPAGRTTVRCVASPSDGEAGRPFEITLVANGPQRVRPRFPPGLTARAEGPARGERSVEVTLTADRRMVLDTVVVELASSAPFGILWWAREVEVQLTRPLHVAPRVGEPGPTDRHRDDAHGDASLRIASEAGESRGIRPYQPGDARQSVHWPASAHTGSLMVREKERQTDEPSVVEVVLPADPLEAESVTERVMATVGRTLRVGQPVLLVTDEIGGRRREVVRDRVGLGRRLARAVPAPQAQAPSPPVPPTPPPRRRS